MITQYCLNLQALNTTLEGMVGLLYPLLIARLSGLPPAQVLPPHLDGSIGAKCTRRRQSRCRNKVSIEARGTFEIAPECWRHRFQAGSSKQRCMQGKCRAPDSPGRRIRAGK